MQQTPQQTVAAVSPTTAGLRKLQPSDVKFQRLLGAAIVETSPSLGAPKKARVLAVALGLQARQQHLQMEAAPSRAKSGVVLVPELVPELAPELAPEMPPELALELALEAAPWLGVVLALVPEAQHPPLEHLLWAWLSDRLDSVRCGRSSSTVVRPGGRGNETSRLLCWTKDHILQPTGPPPQLPVPNSVAGVLPAWQEAERHRPVEPPRDEGGDCDLLVLRGVELREMADPILPAPEAEEVVFSMWVGLEPLPQPPLVEASAPATSPPSQHLPHSPWRLPRGQRVGLGSRHAQTPTPCLGAEKPRPRLRGLREGGGG